MIYFIANSYSKSVKIGYSLSPKQRFSQLQIGNSYKLDLIGVMKGDREVERDIHNKFKKYHIRGEWYKLNDNIIKFITEYATIIKNRDNTFVRILELLGNKKTDILRYLALNSNRERIVFKSKREMSNELNISYAIVHNLIDKLLKAKYLKNIEGIGYKLCIPSLGAIKQ